MSDMKTALTTALKEANVPVKPQIQRIWEYLRDNPGRIASRVKRDLYLAEGSTSSLLSQLVKREMVTFVDEHDRLGRRRLFYVNPSMREYELLPKKGKGVVKSVVSDSVKAVAETIALLPPLSENPVSQQQVVDTFTVAQAREMYGILHKMFGEKK